MLEKIRNIICDYVEIAPEEITENSLLRKEIGLNSLDYVCIAQELEREFGVTIQNKNLASFKTPGDIIAFIEMNA